jgi:hypothetical protein
MGKLAGSAEIVNNENRPILSLPGHGLLWSLSLARNKTMTILFTPPPRPSSHSSVRPSLSSPSVLCTIFYLGVNLAESIWLGSTPISISSLSPPRGGGAAGTGATVEFEEPWRRWWPLPREGVPRTCAGEGEIPTLTVWLGFLTNIRRVGLIAGFSCSPWRSLGWRRGCSSTSHGLSSSSVPSIIGIGLGVG